MVLRATPVARAVAAMAGAVRLRGHVQSPRPLIKRRTNRFEPQRNGFLVDHPTTLSGSWRGENHPTPRGSYRRAYFWASPKVRLYHACSPLPGATKGNTLEAARIKLCVGIAQHHQTKERPRNDHTFRVSWFAPCRQMHTTHARAFSAIAVPPPPAG